MFWLKKKETCFNQPYAFPHSPYTSAFKVYFCCHENRACLFVIIILLCSKFQKEPIGALPTFNSLSPLLHSLAGSLERGEEWEENASVRSALASFWCLHSVPTSQVSRTCPPNFKHHPGSAPTSCHDKVLICSTFSPKTTELWWEMVRTQP